MNNISFLIKPASGLCDLRCRYCFYTDLTDGRDMGIMSDDTAERLIRSGFDAVSGSGGFVQFTFQGGEPTLAGLDFFEQFVDTVDRYRPEGVGVGYSIQTNGMRLNEQWAKFFKQNGFLVGLSIDGCRDIHDELRVDKASVGSWDRAVASLELLDSYGVETNLLCVITSAVAQQPDGVYSSLRSLGEHALQFIPCLDPMDSPRGSQSYSLTPEAYGEFLCRLFDHWYSDWVQGRYVSIRMFDDQLRILMGMPPSSCAANGACGSYLVAEADGSLYPCDFYVLDQWRLGNIHQMSAEQAIGSPTARLFLQQGAQPPAECGSCRYFALCRGGCRRDRTDEQTNYYCSSLKQFFDHALPRLQQIALSIINQ